MIDRRMCERCIAPLWIAAPPLPTCEIVVIIPVRDEEVCLPAALDALAGQRALDGTPFDPARFEVILLVNNSRDRSANQARAFATRHPECALHVVEIDLPDALAHVGYARRLLMDTAADRLAELGRQRGVIASSDADTVVGPTWLAATLAEIERGVDVVAGRILVDGASLLEHPPAVRTAHLRDVGYRSLVAEVEALLDPDPADPWPRHFQHFGPSLAVTIGAYCRAGGLPPLPALEDVALYDALRRVDARIRHAPAVRVVTSARPRGRTGFGFAVQLERWAAMGSRCEPFLVESLPAIAARLAARRRLRSLWRLTRDGLFPGQYQAEINALALALAVDPRWLRQALGQSRPFGALLQDVETCQEASGVWAARWPPVEIGAAIGDLRRWLAAARSAPRRSDATLEQVDSVELLAAAD